MIRGTPPRWRSLAGGCCALLLVPASALGHTDLVATSPAEGSRLPSAPSGVVVRYSAPLAEVVEASVTVGGESLGGTARLSPADAGRFRIPVTAGASHGRFTARWVVRSEDAHLLRGEVSFTVPSPPVIDQVRQVARLVSATATALRSVSSPG